MPQSSDQKSGQAARRGVDPFTLIIGLGALLVSAVAFTGDKSWLSVLDPRWLLAGGAVLIGVLLLVGTFRRPHKDSGDG